MNDVVGHGDDIAWHRPGFLNPDGTRRKPLRIHKFSMRNPAEPGAEPDVFLESFKRNAHLGLAGLPLIKFKLKEARAEQADKWLRLPNLFF